jgi:hypothetical protein
MPNGSVCGLYVVTPNKRGRPIPHTTPEILDTIFYVFRSGFKLGDYFSAT